MPLYAIQIAQARPLDLATITRANAQWLRIQGRKDGSLFSSDAHREVPYIRHWAPIKGFINVQAQRDIYRWPVDQLAMDATMATYRQARAEVKQLREFWTPAARAAAKGEGLEPIKRERPLMWDGIGATYTPETGRELREHYGC